jgi:hypothetical protein
MATFYISANGSTWSTFASAGIVQCQVTLRATGADTLAFSIDPTTWTAAATYATGATLYFKMDSTVFFVGRVSEVPRDATGVQHRLSYTVLGPWARLENIAYGQTWKLRRASDNEEVDVVKPRVVLGQDNAGAQITNGAQIAAVIDYAIARGIPILKGTVDAGIAMPYDEQRQLSCADAIRKCLRWVPDWVSWWDYSTQDAGVYKPTFHARAVTNLSAATLDLNATTKPEEASLRPRTDIVVPGVRIVYEKTHTYDGNTWNSYDLDTAGNDSDPEAIDLLFELQGDVVTLNKQTVEVADWPDFLTPAGKAFFRLHLPWLEGIADGDLVISEIARDGVEELPSYLVDGAIPDWLLDQVDVEEEIVTAKVAFVRRDGDENPLEDVEEKDVSIKLLSTDATSREYQSIASVTYGEGTPVGVAAALYASWSKLHYEGPLTLLQASPDFAYVPGKKLNITNGLAAWATMDAIIQEASISIADGSTTISIGPPGRLDADTLVALFRATHNRAFSWSRVQRTSSALAGAETSGPKNLPRERPDDGDPGQKRRLQIRAQDPDENLHVLDLAPEDVEFADADDKAPVLLAPRELLIPELVGASYVLKRRQVFASESYHAAVPLSGAVKHPFRFTQTSDTGGNIESGSAYVNGGLTGITDLPASLSSVTVTTRYYVEVDLDAETATWKSTTSGFPDGDADTEIFPILTLTCAASVITDIKQHQWSDIHARSSGSGLDCSLFRFGYSIAGTTVTINAGAIRPSDGRAAVTCAGTSFTLAGDKYVFAEWDRIATTGTISVAAAMPTSTVNLLIVPLYKFNGTGLEAIYHVGDCILDVPIR